MESGDHLMATKIGPHIFAFQRGIIKSVDIYSGIVKFKYLSGNKEDDEAKLPAGWVGQGGEISLGYPSPNTLIYIGLDQGGEKIVVGYDLPNQSTYVDWSRIPEGGWATLTKNDIGIIADPDAGVITGSTNQYIQSDPVRNITSSTFDSEMSFSEAHRQVIGPVLRDLLPNASRNQSYSALTDHIYNDMLNKVGIDPKTITTDSQLNDYSNRNPAFIEARSLFYEFEHSYGYTNDPEEIKLYKGDDLPEYSGFKRRDSRADTLSLALDRPNQLMESIIGTVIDVYGNILDLNRAILPNGLIDSLSLSTTEGQKSEIFKKLREQIRKSIAFHWELNARKAGLDEKLQDLDNVNDYARQRSRLFLDIDKEGQFKINIPSSSETGNVPLLTRYENFSVLYGAKNNKDRDLFIPNEDDIDINLDTHGKGVIELVSGDENLNGFAAPNERIPVTASTSDNPNVVSRYPQIRLGTGFHNIAKGLFLHQIQRPYGDRKNPGDMGNGSYDSSLINYVSPIGDLVSSQIKVSGPNANAGGRSGTISLDGFISVSIGANTVDRQSLWMDMAGGAVMNVGRDRFNRSLAATMDGDVYMQVGGYTITDDSRFSDPAVFNNNVRDGTVDIRVWNSGSFHTVRIDPTGINIHSPGNITVVAETNLRLKALRGNLLLEGEKIIFFGDLDPRGLTRQSGSIRG